jgi:uncharacterized membrane protein HdeD (DUF308 family)
MSEGTEVQETATVEGARAELKGLWGLFVGFGLVSIFLGCGAIVYPLLAGIVAATLVGWVFVISGVLRAVNAVSCRRCSHGSTHRLIGALIRLMAGVLILIFPGATLITLTVMLVVFFIFDGIYKFSLARAVAPLGNSGWLMFSAVISLILALLILLHLPGSAAWAFGLIIGIDLLFTGWSNVMLGLGLRRVAAAA